MTICVNYVKLVIMSIYITFIPPPLGGSGGVGEARGTRNRSPDQGEGWTGGGVRHLRGIGRRGGRAGRMSDEGGCRLRRGPPWGAQAGCLPQEPALPGLPFAPRRWGRCPPSGRGSVGG